MQGLTGPRKEFEFYPKSTENQWSIVKTSVTQWILHFENSYWLPRGAFIETQREIENYRDHPGKRLDGWGSWINVNRRWDE